MFTWQEWNEFESVFGSFVFTCDIYCEYPSRGSKQNVVHLNQTLFINLFYLWRSLLNIRDLIWAKEFYIKKMGKVHRSLF